MSAFIVSDKHIKTIIIKAGYTDENTILDKANTLMAENVRSVDYRYNEKNPFFPVRSALSDPIDGLKVSVVQALKLCDCLEYQSCETPDYYQTEAYSLLNDLRKLLIHSLDGYEEADWAII